MADVGSSFLSAFTSAQQLSLDRRRLKVYEDDAAARARYTDSMILDAEQRRELEDIEKIQPAQAKLRIAGLDNNPNFEFDNFGTLVPGSFDWMDGIQRYNDNSFLNWQKTDAQFKAFDSSPIGAAFKRATTSTPEEVARLAADRNAAEGSALAHISNPNILAEAERSGVDPVDVIRGRTKAHDENMAYMAEYMTNKLGPQFEGFEITSFMANPDGTYTPLVRAIDSDDDPMPMTEGRSSRGDDPAIKIPGEDLQDQFQTAIQDDIALDGLENYGSRLKQYERYDAAWRAIDFEAETSAERLTNLPEALFMSEKPVEEAIIDQINRDQTQALLREELIRNAQRVDVTTVPMLASVIAGMSEAELMEVAIEELGEDVTKTLLADLATLQEQQRGDYPTATRTDAATNYNQALTELRSSIAEFGEAPVDDVQTRWGIIQLQRKKDDDGNTLYPGAIKQWELKKIVRGDVAYYGEEEEKTGAYDKNILTRYGIDAELRQLTVDRNNTTSGSAERRTVEAEIATKERERNEVSELINARAERRSVDLARFDGAASVADTLNPTIQKLHGNQSKEFVQRILDPASNPPGPPGFENSSHLMAAEFRDGKWVVFPTIVNQDGTLVKLEQSETSNEAYDYAKANNEFIDFGQDEESARAFAKDGYKTQEFNSHFDRERGRVEALSGAISANREEQRPRLERERLEAEIAEDYRVAAAEQELITFDALLAADESMGDSGPSAVATKQLAGAKTASEVNLRLTRMPPEAAMATIWAIVANSPGLTQQQRMTMAKEMISALTTGVMGKDRIDVMLADDTVERTRLQEERDAFARGTARDDARNDEAWNRRMQVTDDLNASRTASTAEMNYRLNLANRDDRLRRDRITTSRTERDTAREVVDELAMDASGWLIDEYNGTLIREGDTGYVSPGTNTNNIKQLVMLATSEDESPQVRARASSRIQEIFALKIINAGKKRGGDGFFEKLTRDYANEIPIQDIANNLVINKEGNKIAYKGEGNIDVYQGETTVRDIQHLFGALMTRQIISTLEEEEF